MPDAKRALAPIDGTCCMDWLPAEVMEMVLREVVLGTPTRTTFATLRAVCRTWNDITAHAAFRAFFLRHHIQLCDNVSLPMLYYFYPTQQVYASVEQLFETDPFPTEYGPFSTIINRSQMLRRMIALHPLFAQHGCRIVANTIEPSPEGMILATWKHRDHPKADYRRGKQNVIKKLCVSRTLESLMHMQQNYAYRSFPFHEWKLATVEYALSIGVLYPTHLFIAALRAVIGDISILTYSTSMACIERASSNIAHYVDIFKILLDARKMDITVPGVSHALFMWFWNSTYSSVQWRLPEFVRTYGLEPPDSWRFAAVSTTVTGPTNTVTLDIILRDSVSNALLEFAKKQ